MYLNVFPVCVAGIKTCSYVLQVSAADLLRKGKDPCPELSADKQKSEKTGITESLVPSNTA